MDESERNRLLKRQRMLGLAASDMRQAESAARALPTTTPVDFHLRRALMTAVVVSYSRAFTKSTIVTLRREEYEPTDGQLGELHNRILDLRDTVSAHTDKNAGRTISVTQGLDDSVAVGEAFDQVLSPDDLTLGIELFEIQRVRFLDEAIKIAEAARRCSDGAPIRAPTRRRNR